MAFTRFCDRKDLNITGRQDFRLRPKDQQIQTLFIMVILIILGVCILLYNAALLAAEICVVVGVIMYFITSKYEKIHRQLLAAEFMSAMFASALAINCKFCMVVKPDGDIVYFDREFQQMFPDFFALEKHTLEVLFGAYPLESDSGQKIISLVADAKKETVNIFIAGGADKTMCPIRLSIEPIPRPSGFILLRGNAL